MLKEKKKKKEIGKGVRIEKPCGNINCKCNVINRDMCSNGT